MFKLSLRCHKHPRYNPQRHSDFEIKGNCPFCLSLLTLYRKVNRIERLSNKQLWDAAGEAVPIPLVLMLPKQRKAEGPKASPSKQTEVM